MNDGTLYLLRQYIALPRKIYAYQERLDNFSKEYYKQHSFMGNSFYNPVLETGQSSINPEDAVMHIIGTEVGLRKTIERLEIRRELFSNEFTAFERRKMRRNIAKRKITFLEIRAMKFLSTIQNRINTESERAKREEVLEKLGWNGKLFDLEKLQGSDNLSEFKREVQRCDYNIAYEIEKI